MLDFFLLVAVFLAGIFLGDASASQSESINGASILSESDSPKYLLLESGNFFLAGIFLGVEDSSLSARSTSAWIACLTMLDFFLLVAVFLAGFFFGDSSISLWESISISVTAAFASLAEMLLRCWVRVPSTAIFCLPLALNRRDGNLEVGVFALFVDFNFFGGLASSSKSSSESDPAPSESDCSNSEFHSSTSAFFFGLVDFFATDFVFVCLALRLLTRIAFFVSIDLFLSASAVSSSSKSDSQIDSGVVDSRAETSASLSSFWRRISSARSKVSVQSFNPSKYS